MADQRKRKCDLCGRVRNVEDLEEVTGGTYGCRPGRPGYRECQDAFGG
jgi:hypothetical protein